MQFKKIVMLAGDGDTTAMVYNYFHEPFEIACVIIEQPVARKEFLKKRIKRLGWTKVAGQVLFQVLLAKPMKRASGSRIQEILQQYGLSTVPVPVPKTIWVSSVNSPACLEALQRLQPDLVIVHGTRIISKKILEGINATFINIHAGITPRYRGSHGAYWALANNDRENCGVTVHLVDPGIDTGNILAQGTIPLTPKDNFATYPYLQLGEGLRLLKDILIRMQSGEKPGTSNPLNSALWHHPTLWGYLYHRLLKKIK